MGFRPQDVEELLARTGRMCAICKGRHRVQVHHITPVSEGGADEIVNAIPLCPNCHDEVHWRDGTLIERARGKVHVANPVWRERLDEAAAAIDTARRLLRHALGLDVDLYRWEHEHASDRLRYNCSLGAGINSMRQTAVESVNAILRDVGQPELRGTGVS